MIATLLLWLGLAEPTSPPIDPCAHLQDRRARTDCIVEDMRHWRAGETPDY